MQVRFDIVERPVDEANESQSHSSDHSEVQSNKSVDLDYDSLSESDK